MKRKAAVESVNEDVAHRDARAKINNRSTPAPQATQNDDKREGDFPAVFQIKYNRSVRRPWPSCGRRNDREQQNARAPRRNSGDSMEILRAVAEDILINDGRVLNERGKISYKGNDLDYGEKNKTNVSILE